MDNTAARDAVEEAAIAVAPNSLHRGGTEMSSGEGAEEMIASVPLDKPSSPSDGSDGDGGGDGFRFCDCSGMGRSAPMEKTEPSSIDALLSGVRWDTMLHG